MCSPQRASDAYRDGRPRAAGGETGMPDSEYILEMRHVSKRFASIRALDDVTFRVRKGTVHALMGENGAGKSTLMKILNGLHRPDAGEIILDGERIEPDSAHAAARHGIAMIHQELSSVPNLTIGENIFLGREPMLYSCLAIDKRKLFADAQALLDRVKVNVDARTPMGALSVSKMQQVEICKALSFRSKIIIMDEPTSAITENEVQTLFSLIRDLKAEGVSIIYITHKMDELFQIADEVTVLRDGRFIDTLPVAEVDRDKVITMMIGRDLTEMFPKGNNRPGEVVLTVSNLRKEGVFHDVSFEVRQGEIVGLAGLIGSGRTEVMRCIFGLDRHDSGEIRWQGQALDIRDPSDAVDRGIVMVPEDRKLSGVVQGLSIKFNLSLGFLKNFLRIISINKRKETSESGRISGRLSIKTNNINNPVSSLSGGNQQKVVLGKWLIGRVKLLILDEPTRGIDVGAKSEIHRLMAALAEEGLPIIMISSEMPEVIGMSDRIYVMHEGTIRGELPRSEFSQERIMQLAIGG